MQISNPPDGVKRPASEARLRANRENAKKSTGPRTEEGKQHSRVNAARHHLLTAQVISLPEEEMQALHECIRQFMEEYKPVGFHETNLVHMLAQSQYRLHRLAYSEHNLFTIGHVENSGDWNVDNSEARNRLRVRGYHPPLERPAADFIYLRAAPDASIRANRKNVARPADRAVNLRSSGGKTDLYAVAVCHTTANVPFKPAEFGFVCSEDEIGNVIKRRGTIERAHYARQCRFEPDQCKAAISSFSSLTRLGNYSRAVSGC